MTAQIVGSTFLLGAAVMYTVSIRKKESYQQRALEDALAFVDYAKTKIHLFDTHTTELLSDFYLDGHRDMLADRSTDLVVWAEHISYYLADADSKTLKHFAASLGGTYKEDAVRLCEYTYSRLQDSYRQSEKEYPARIRLHTALPILLACTLMVLFW